MQNIKKLQNYINNKIEDLKFPSIPENLYEPIKYILSIGGKRLRPLLSLISSKMFGGNLDNSINPAIALEIFHNFTLLHDDIMDNAEIRRNQPTVHKKWNENIAILSGDAMMFIANQFISKTEDKHLKSILELFNKTAIEVCEGQQYDMNFETRLDVTEDEYIEMIRLKTSVLIAAALKFGAITANASIENADKIYEYGINIGLAFQLQDDLLDTFGDVNVFGKKIGGDIVANKKTYLLISALNTANQNDKQLLLNFLEQKDNPEDKIEKVKNIYNKYKIKEIIENKINFYFENAEKIINNITVNKEDKSTLKNFILQLSNRKH